MFDFITLARTRCAILVFFLFLWVPQVCRSQVLQTIHSFATQPRSPNSKLLLAKDGNFYGTTDAGGNSDVGTIFKLTPEGQMTVLDSIFVESETNSLGSLMQASNGVIYGTSSGPTPSYPRGYKGTVFKLSPTGTAVTISGGDYYFGVLGPLSGMIEASDGNLYGSLPNYGDGYGYFPGAMFRVVTNGYVYIRNVFYPTVGTHPVGVPVEARPGVFYTPASSGGSYNKGTVCAVSLTSAPSLVFEFNGTNGANPQAGLMKSANGYFYGTTYSGGRYDKGTVFKMSANGVLDTLVSFEGLNGANPRAEVIEDGEGNLYGTTERGGTFDKGTVFRIAATGEISTLFSFDGSRGANPRTALTMSPNGYLYGTTFNSEPIGGGTIFKISRNGEFTMLVRFCNDEGWNPVGLNLASDGSFYGATAYGGVAVYGTVFKSTADGKLEVLASFGGTNGARPMGVVQGDDMNLYGVTSRGGTENKGTLFSISPAGQITTLVYFNSTNYGMWPSANLLKAKDGSLYGTTTFGGVSGPSSGSVFKYTPGGSFTTLFDFSQTNGAYPSSQLIQTRDGAIYGTTSQGGTNGAGTIFRVGASGQVETLFSFDRNVNGAYPYGKLLEGSDGCLYGTTQFGGSNYYSGTVFRYAPSGTLSVLYTFANPASGAAAGLSQGADGTLYGTTDHSMTGRAGTLFSLSLTGAFRILARPPMNYDGWSYAESSPILGKQGAIYGTTLQQGPLGGGTLYRVVMPFLEISRVNSNLAVTWPALIQDYQLESSMDVGSGWQAVSGLPTVGEIQNTMVVPVSLQPQYFRLRQKTN